MFNFSWSEIIICLFVAVIFIKPEELPEIVRWSKGVFRKIKNFKDQVLKEMDSLTETTKEQLSEDFVEINESIHDIKYIFGDDGKPYLSYDVAELDQLKQKLKEDV